MSYAKNSPRIAALAAAVYLLLVCAALVTRPASAAQTPANSPIVLFWELPPDEDDGVASGITGAQGWTFSTEGTIVSVELFVDGTSEGELPCCSPRRDVMEAVDGAPLRTGFNGVMSWGRFTPGLHDMELVVSDSAGNVLRETRQVRTVKVLSGIPFARDLSLLGASCEATGVDEITCTGVEFLQSDCAGPLTLRWQNGKQAFEVAQGCTSVAPTPKPTPSPAVAATPTPPPASTPTPISPATPGPTGANTLADCMNPAVCSVCITEPVLEGYAFYNIVMAPGETRTYCAPVLPPYIDSHPDTIRFQFYDQSDKDCGLLYVEVQQTTGTEQTLSTGAFLSAGTLSFRSQIGPNSFPERTEPGIYRFHITGGNGCATEWRLAWAAF